jgi:TM2 domain-containing membrane protein YozV
MLLLPVLNFLYLYIFSRGDLKADILENMILCNISHTGIFLLLFFIKSVKEKSYNPADGKKFLKFINASVMRVSLFILSAVYILLPYLLYYHLETDLFWVGVFHFFLISAVISSYKFYKENFMDVLSGLDEETEDGAFFT